MRVLTIDDEKNPKNGVAIILDDSEFDMNLCPACKICEMKTYKCHSQMMWQTCCDLCKYEGRDGCSHPEGFCEF